MNNREQSRQQSGMKGRASRRIALFGHFGAGNLGNESTLIAMLSHLREVGPEVDIHCICSVPDAVTADYRIPATPINDYVVRPWANQGIVVRLIRKFLIGIPSEMYRWFRAARTLRGTEMLIVVGTGLLTDAFGLSGWGPYSVFKWTAVAWLMGCRVCFVSIGAGPLNGVIARSFARSALSLARFCSYRDEATKEYLHGIGIRSPKNQVSPDLAFSLPAKVLPRRCDVDRLPAIIGVGVMYHGGMYGIERTTQADYVAYIDALLVFCEWLLHRGDHIRLIIGDNADIPIVEEFYSLLRERVGQIVEQRVLANPPQSIKDLLQQIEETKCVVATRFHNALLAMLLNKPTLSISFHHKCSALMDQMSLSKYCLDIRQVTGDRLISEFRQMEENASTLRQVIRKKVDENRTLLGDQYIRLFQSADARPA